MKTQHFIATMAVCFLAVCSLFGGVAVTEPIPAFPEAEGAGALAIGGRGGQVVKVINLNADGPGSLADAVSRGNRIVSFEVSGMIDLGRTDGDGKMRPGKIQINHPNITIAGQTAPGEGIGVMHGSLDVKAGNIIIRHIRISRGYIVDGNQGDALTVKGDNAEFPIENVILDHVSPSWTTDENLTVVSKVTNATVQYALMVEGLDYYNPPQTLARHSEGSMLGSASRGA